MDWNAGQLQEREEGLFERWQQLLIGQAAVIAQLLEETRGLTDGLKRGPVTERGGGGE